jgi:hypothetical protein
MSTYLGWRESSAGGGILVSLRDDGDVAIKRAVSGRVVNVSRAEWDAFVVGVKAGEFDLAVPSHAPGDSR